MAGYLILTETSLTDLLEILPTFFSKKAKNQKTKKGFAFPFGSNRFTIKGNKLEREKNKSQVFEIIPTTPSFLTKLTPSAEIKTS